MISLDQEQASLVLGKKREYSSTEKRQSSAVVLTSISSRKRSKTSVEQDFKKKICQKQEMLGKYWESMWREAHKNPRLIHFHNRANTVV
mmetsp:Transcript_11054/g.12617  ORF Transcript_11054/g.12617 Transcript_11054/m.12617 type:complete len:89 (-) Transcript_11054:672-938(-)